MPMRKRFLRHLQKEQQKEKTTKDKRVGEKMNHNNKFFFFHLF